MPHAATTTTDVVAARPPPPCFATAGLKQTLNLPRKGLLSSQRTIKCIWEALRVDSQPAAPVSISPQYLQT